MKHDSDILKRIKTYFMRRKVAEDAHAFEEEMERDAFLYEAIEGFEDMHVSDVQQALDELDDRLDKKASRRFAVPWKMVAGFAAVIGVGIATFSVIPTGGSDVAKESAPAENVDKPGYSPRYVQPSFGVLEAPAANDIAESDTTETEHSPEEQTIAFEDVSRESPTSTETAEQSTVDIQPKKLKEQQEKLATSALEDDSNESLANEALTTEENDRDVAVDELVTLDVTTVEPEVVQSTPVRAVELQKTRSASTQSNNAKPSVPAVGMPSYKKYLRENLKKTDEMPRGSVMVSFEFDKDGKPRRVKVENSLCESCDAEAQRLIESGPAWKVEDRKERVTMEVVFP